MDEICNDCLKYACDYYITDGKKGHVCLCSCHKNKVRVSSGK